MTVKMVFISQDDATGSKVTKDIIKTIATGARRRGGAWAPSGPQERDREGHPRRPDPPALPCRLFVCLQRCSASWALRSQLGCLSEGPAAAGQSASDSD